MYERDLRAITNLHMFAYNGRNVSVTQRVANESAATADAAYVELYNNGPPTNEIALGKPNAGP